MFGPDYENGACPGCTSLADGLDGALIHLNHRDVTLICFSRAPIERLVAYKARMGWQFPYVSTYNTDFAFEFGLALTEEQAQQIPEVRAMIDNPPAWLEEWSRQVGAELKHGLPRSSELDRLRSRKRDRVPHVHGEGARPVRRAVLQLPARTHAEAPASGASHLAQGRVPRLRRPGAVDRDSERDEDTLARDGAAPAWSPPTAGRQSAPTLLERSPGCRKPSTAQEVR